MATRPDRLQKQEAGVDAVVLGGTDLAYDFFTPKPSDGAARCRPLRWRSEVTRRWPYRRGDRDRSLRNGRHASFSSTSQEHRHRRIGKQGADARRRRCFRLSGIRTGASPRLRSTDNLVIRGNAAIGSRSVISVRSAGPLTAPPTSTAKPSASTKRSSTGRGRATVAVDAESGDPLTGSGLVRRPIRQLQGDPVGRGFRPS